MSAHDRIEKKSKTVAQVMLAKEGTRAHKILNIRMENECNANVHNNNDDDGLHVSVALLHDSGSNAHLTNVKGVLQDMKACSTSVYGINGEGGHKPLHASMQGSVNIPFSPNHHVMVDDVLYLPSSVLGSSVGERKRKRRRKRHRHFVPLLLTPLIVQNLIGLVFVIFITLKKDARMENLAPSNTRSSINRT